MTTLRTPQTAAHSGRLRDFPTAIWRRSDRHRGTHCNASVKAQAIPGVRIDVEKTSWNSRRIFASVAVATPKKSVWSALTDYERLGTFIPSLVENRCVERNRNSVVLYQVGAQDVAMGVKFSAAVTLRCTEFADGGVPAHLVYGSRSSSSGSASSSHSSDEWSSESNGGSGGSVESLFPFPTTTVPGVASSDISFEQLEGDFQSFRGLWRMQQTGEESTVLSYALFVKPQAWLPVALIQGRIENEVVRNLEAVSRYAEGQYQQQRQRQRQLS